jgi:transcriptional antiterminator RfaH
MPAALTSPLTPTPFWAVARTAAQREKFAAERISEIGFEVFAPRIRERVGLRWRVAPFFRGYIFVRVIDGRWHPIARALGVLKLVKFGDAPAHCPDAEIEALMDRVDPDGIIKLPAGPPPSPRRIIRPGAKVKITSGPFQGLAGIYQGMTKRERELVLLRVLGGQRSVAIPAAAIEPQ